MGESKGDFLGRGVRIAQRLGRKGLEPGTVIAHPSDPVTYILDRVEDGVAHVSLPADAAKDGKAVKKTFPAKEIFDVNLAKDAAVDRKVKATLRGWNKDIEKAKRN